MKHVKDQSTLRWICNVAGKTQLYIGVLVLIQVFLGASAIVYALLMRELIDAAVAGNSPIFLRYAIIFGSLVLMQIAFRALSRFFVEHTRISIENRFKTKVFSYLLHKNYESVNNVHSGEWLNRLTSDTHVVADSMVTILPGLIGMAVRLSGALCMLLVLEPRFAYFVLAGGLILLAFSYKFRKIMKQMHKRVQEADGQVRISFQEYLTSLLVVRAYGVEDMVQDETVGKMRRHKRAVMSRNHFSNLCNIGIGIMMHGAYVFGVVFGGYGILKGTISYGTFTAILQLIGQVQNPFANITGYLPKYYGMIASAERLRDAEALPDKEVVGMKDAKEVQDIYQSKLTEFGLRKASFTYQSSVQVPVGEIAINQDVTRTLENVDLSIKKGEYVAFTGPSGCGKTTVLKLLLGLYPLDEGERYLQFGEQEEALHSGWQKLFAYVPQGNHLMSGTIREIIAFSNREAMHDEERMNNALTIACAKEFVEELELGVDTPLGERGTGLSEGQMQRLAIARAVFSEHPILLLDEATSALDEKTEHDVLHNLRKMTDKTVLIITHRPAVLEICDKIGAFSQEGIQVLSNKACKK